MVEANKKNTEELILETARQIFMEKGMAATRMQEIADRAGINKALLHYYFRSKEKLFDEVIRNIFSELIPKIENSITDPADIHEGLSQAVEFYFDLLLQYPFLPQFIISEIYRDPGHLQKSLISKLGLAQLAQNLINTISKHQREAFDPKQFIVSFISMIIFPFAAKPLLEMIMFDGDHEAYQKFLLERKKHLPDMIKKLLPLQNNKA